MAKKRNNKKNQINIMQSKKVMELKIKSLGHGMNVRNMFMDIILYIKVLQMKKMQKIILKL